MLTHAAPIVAFVAMLPLIFYLAQLPDKQAERGKSVAHTLSVLNQIDLIERHLLQAENFQRDYLLLAMAETPPLYRNAAAALNADIEAFGKLTADNPNQQKRIVPLRHAIESEFSDLNKTIERATNGDRAGAVALTASGEHSRKTLAIDQQLKDMSDEERNLLKMRESAWAQAFARTQKAFFIGSIAVCGLTIVLYLLAWRNRSRNKAAEQQRTTLIAHLTRSNSELERFAYVASHDMQEPLRMITSFSEIMTLEYGKSLDETGKEYIGIIADAAIRMQRMVADLLEYGRIDGGGSLRFQNVNGEGELGRTLESLAIVLRESKAEITSDKMPVFLGNPVQFGSLLQNLIGNGLKFQAQGHRPKIHIGVESLKDEWHFSVHDNGIGIEPRYIDQIFEPFKRLHTWEQYQGSGLGLSICKKIVENHGGRIWVTSVQGEGTVFHFTMPRGETIETGKSAV